MCEKILTANSHQESGNQSHNGVTSHPFKMAMGKHTKDDIRGEILICSGKKRKEPETLY